jgi:hypothetical protein
VAPEGTGRARAGSNGSPLWRGGGRIFPNSPQDNFSQKVNKKMFRAGMAAILSELARQDRLVVIDGLSIDAPKTKLFAQKLKGMGLEGNLLVITDALDENLYLSSRNLPNVLVLEARKPIRCRWSALPRCWSPRTPWPSSRRCGDESRASDAGAAGTANLREGYLCGRQARAGHLSVLRRCATKPEIKAAVELLFKVEVETVQVANVKGKVKRFKGRRPPQGLEEGLREPQAGPGNQFR